MMQHSRKMGKFCNMAEALKHSFRELQISVLSASLGNFVHKSRFMQGFGTRMHIGLATCISQVHKASGI